MSTMLAPPPPSPRSRVRTLADVVADLGDVPLFRIMADPPLGTATEADVLAALAEPQKRICELIEGVLVEKPMGMKESALAMELVRHLGNHVKPQKLGTVTGEAGTLQLTQGLVRIPDVAFISWDKFPDRRLPKEPIPNIVPDLAVEILSVSNTLKEMLRKRQEYFRAGVREVWIIDPDRRTLAVYHRAESPERVLQEADTLSGSQVLPNFVLPLRELFAELDQVA